MSEPVRVAVIGGSGVYDIEGLADVEELRLDSSVSRPKLGQLARDSRGA